MDKKNIQQMDKCLDKDIINKNIRLEKERLGWS